LLSMASAAYAKEAPFNWTASTAAARVDMQIHFEGMTVDRSKIRLASDAAADPRLTSARNFFNDRQFEQARTQFETYLSISTDTLESCEARFESGLTLSRLQLYGQAIERWKELAARPACPNGAQALFHAGYIQEGLGKWDEALRTYEEIAQRFLGGPEEQDARFEMTQCYFNKGDFTNADKQFLSFQKAYPDDARLQRACQALRSAHELRKDPQDQSALRFLRCSKKS